MIPGMISHEFSLVLILILTLSFGFEGSVSFAWHENLGITDEKATEMFNNPVLSPDTLKMKNDTLNWIAGLKDRYAFITDFCLPGSGGNNPDGEGCKSEVKMVFDNCLHHPGIDTLCQDPNIETYMIRHNLSGTYDMSYRRMEPIEPGKGYTGAMADITKKAKDLCKSLSLQC